MNKKSILNLAIEIFVNNTKYLKQDIIKIKKLHKGYTNISFLFKTKDKNKFQVRLGHNNDIVDRKNELEIIKLLPYDYYCYIDEKGNAIKKWVDGKNPKLFINKKKVIDALLLEIIKIHSIDITNSNILVHDYEEFIDDFILQNYKIYINKYREILKKYNLEKLFFSHNDINVCNFLYNKKNSSVTLIDFEWSRINNQYWDYANFYRETNLKKKWLVYISKKTNLDFNVLFNYVFISMFYALMWTYKVDQTKKIIKYRKKVKKKIKKIFPYL